MINQGASEISMMFGIRVEDAEKAVLSTYEFCYHGICLKIYVHKDKRFLQYIYYFSLY